MWTFTWCCSCCSIHPCNLEGDDLEVRASLSIKREGLYDNKQNWDIFHIKLIHLLVLFWIFEEELKHPGLGEFKR
ncbi:hypothetical protein LXL04_018439 [Taraxacum kok-saghyz]